MPQPRSVVVIGLPHESGTVATVLCPELSGLRSQAEDQVAASGVQPVGAERFFPGDDDTLLSRELSRMAYKLVEFLRHYGCEAF